MKNDVELIMLDKHNMKPLIDYINELQDYKLRLDKAVEYIEKERFIKDGNLGIYVDLDYNDTEHLLKILKGEEKNG